MKLYEIENAILECIDTETGEVIDIERLNELQMERETKIENVACWIKDLKAEAEAIKAGQTVAGATLVKNTSVIIK